MSVLPYFNVLSHAVGTWFDVSASIRPAFGRYSASILHVDPLQEISQAFQDRVCLKLLRHFVLIMEQVRSSASHTFVPRQVGPVPGVCSRWPDRFFDRGAAAGLLTSVGYLPVAFRLGRLDVRRL